MTDNMRPKRAADILKYLMDENKSYTQAELAEHFGIHPTVMKRVLAFAETSGALDIDKTRQPYLYKYRKGATPNFYSAFTFRDNPETEMSVRDQCNDLLSHVGEDWKLPPMNAGLGTIFAALICAHLEDNDSQDQYEEFLDAVAAKPRHYYVAYRVVKTMQSMSRRERITQKDGIQYKKSDPDVDLRLILRDNFKNILKVIA